MNQLFKTKDLRTILQSGSEHGQSLKRTLGPWALIGLGVGAVIGSGIFSLPGVAAAGTTDRIGAGPAVTVSFLVAAFACFFAALCYAELASMIPVAGSAYTYSYATLGELVAWIIGWDLILEYAVSNMMVAVGFSGYINELLQAVFGAGAKIPDAWSQATFSGTQATGAIYNLPAMIIVMLLTVLLVRGVKESASANTIMVFVKIGAILLFIFGAIGSVKGANLVPFSPNGLNGIISGAAIVFFTYIGFDSVSTAAEECHEPQKTLPIGIIGTLLLCTVLYMAVAFTLTGAVNYKELAGSSSPVAYALNKLGLSKLTALVSVGALFGMISSLLVYQYGQARIWFAMSRDGLLPKAFSRVHPKFQTPHWGTWIAGLAVGIPAGLWDINTFADLASIGTLFAFCLVSIAVIVLRKKLPDQPRKFRCPLVPLVPLAAVACCGMLMISLPKITWAWFIGWLIIGLGIYALYGYKNSQLREKTTT
jgi:basic amino acid/polyamine antiporter, APA family